jgi:predicted dehydrogenase
VHHHDGSGSWSPPVDPTEPLRGALTHFVECVVTGATPQSDGEAGWRVVRILEAASASLAARGAPVGLVW